MVASCSELPPPESGIDAVWIRREEQPAAIRARQRVDSTPDRSDDRLDRTSGDRNAIDLGRLEVGGLHAIVEIQEALVRGPSHPVRVLSSFTLEEFLRVLTVGIRNDETVAASAPRTGVGDALAARRPAHPLAGLHQVERRSPERR